MVLDEEIQFVHVGTTDQVADMLTKPLAKTQFVTLRSRLLADCDPEVPISVTQDDVVMRGHAIECRINAEKPDEGFRPSVGTIDRLHFPGGPGVRIDSYLTSGSKVQPFYDSLIAKVITYGANRDEALTRMRRVLDEMIVSGISTTASFHRALLDNAYFLRGDVHTTFVETEYRGEEVGV